MFHSSHTFNRRSFLKRAGGVAGVVAASTLIPSLPVGADVNPSDVTATAEDMSPAERYTVVQWAGDAAASIQIRQLLLFGSWSAWQDIDTWSDSDELQSDTHHSGLILTTGAQALQVRALTANVSNLAIMRVSGNAATPVVAG